MKSLKIRIELNNEQTTLARKHAGIARYAYNWAEQKPVDSIILYALNTPLFSNYTEKLRFVKIPEGKTVAYNPTEVLSSQLGQTS